MKEEYNNLYNIYKNMSQKELEEIVNSKDEYREIAKKVASDILNSDRTEYYNNIKQHNAIKQDYNNKIEKMKNHPLYFLINQIANDIRFFKILTIVLLIISIIIGCVLIYQYNHFINILHLISKNLY